MRSEPSNINDIALETNIFLIISSHTALKYISAFVSIQLKTRSYLPQQAGIFTKLILFFYYMAIMSMRDSLKDSFEVFHYLLDSKQILGTETENIQN